MTKFKKPLLLMISLTTLFKISHAQFPNVNLPPINLPNIAIPNFNLPNLNLPNLNLPNLNMPNINLPNINMPNINLPNINMPNLNIPNPFDKLDVFILEKMDEACQFIITKEDLKGLNPSKIRVVEYTALGYRSHETYPSAALSVMQSSHFNKDNPTVIFVHGFTDSPMLVAGKTVADAYKNSGLKYNVLALDSSQLIKNFYLRSVMLVKYIGEYLSYFIYDLTRLGLDPQKLHLVGHSLGAHISGYSGKKYQILRPGEKLPRITGLDPANPCFFHTGPENRLNSSDAHFVDVIHSNVGVAGLANSIGHVDFFPNNGGPVQPGCNDASCSHSRSWEFYAESVRSPQNFIGVQCNSWESFFLRKCTNNERVVMGYWTPTTTRGNFYLRTGSASDYGLGEQGVL